MSIRNNNSGVVGGIVALIIIIIIIAAVVAAWWFWGGGNGNNGTTTTTAPVVTQPTAQQKIRTNWEKFFNGQTTASTKIGLLQNGDQYTQVIQAQSKSATAQATTAKVSNVTVNGDTATVTYTIYENGKAALTNRTGQAVLVDNIWKVSDTAFCNLLQLSGNVPPNCPTSGSGSNTTQQNTGTNGTTTNGTSGTTGTGQTQTQSGTTNTTL